VTQTIFVSDDIVHILEEKRMRLQRAIDRLPEPNRSALVLTYFEGRDVYHVADVLDIPLLSAQSLIVDSLRRLRALL
jgi:DNA-directed RNA polymerase specialized sigma24 family protein